MRQKCALFCFNTKILSRNFFLSNMWRGCLSKDSFKSSKIPSYLCMYFCQLKDDGFFSAEISIILHRRKKILPPGILHMFFCLPIHPMLNFCVFHCHFLLISFLTLEWFPSTDHTINVPRCLTQKKKSHSHVPRNRFSCYVLEIDELVTIWIDSLSCLPFCVCAATLWRLFSCFLRGWRRRREKSFFAGETEWCILCTQHCRRYVCWSVVKTFFLIIPVSCSHSAHAGFLSCFIVCAILRWDCFSRWTSKTCRNFSFFCCTYTRKVIRVCRWTRWIEVKAHFGSDWK